MNPFGIPEMSVSEMASRRSQGDKFVLLDVRESLELQLANFEGMVHVPLSKIAAQRLNALPEDIKDKDTEIVVVCHHGNRSAQVAAWLRGQGWTNIWNLTGGIDAYARQIDQSVGIY